MKKSTSNGAQNSTTDVSFCTVIIRLSQWTTVITTVYSESKRGFPASREVSLLIYVINYIAWITRNKFFPTKSVINHAQLPSNAHIP